MCCHYACCTQVAGGLLPEALMLLDRSMLPNTNIATRAIGYRQALDFMQASALSLVVHLTVKIGELDLGWERLRHEGRKTGTAHLQSTVIVRSMMLASSLMECPCQRQKTAALNLQTLQCSPKRGNFQ
jgi:hypothetical protein